MAALITANGAFVAAEFALVAIDRGRVDRQAAEGRVAARQVAAVLSRLSFHLSGAQLGITITSLVLGFLTEPVIAPIFEPLMRSIVGEDREVATSVVLAVVLATIVQMVMGELVPKSLAIAEPERMAYRLAGAMRGYGFAVGPLVRFLNGVANWTVRRLGIEPAEELRSVRSLEELDLLFRSSGEEGHIDEEAVTMLTRTVRFSEKSTAVALVPRTEVVGISVDDSVLALTDAAVTSGHSRFPVFSGDLDEIVGVGHVKDAFKVPYDERANTTVREVMSEALVVPESMDLSSLMALLQERATHLAVVVDEYGGTAGIITLEDVLEEIVGEIDDEYDTPVALTKVQRPGEWDLAGGLHIDEVFDTCGFAIPTGPYETLAGYMLDKFGHIPDAGEQVENDGWILAVLRMERLRIAEVHLVAPVPPTEPDDGAA